VAQEALGWGLANRVVPKGAHASKQKSLQRDARIPQTCLRTDRGLATAVDFELDEALKDEGRRASRPSWRGSNGASRSLRARRSGSFERNLNECTLEDADDSAVGMSRTAPT